MSKNALSASFTHAAATVLPGALLLLSTGGGGWGLAIANIPQPLPHIPPDAVVLMSIGTNDVPGFIGSPHDAAIRR